MEDERQFTWRDVYDRLSMEYVMSARMYFNILRLAVCHITGNTIEKSTDIMKSNPTEEVWECACDIAKAMYKMRGEK